VLDAGASASSLAQLSFQEEQGIGSVNTSFRRRAAAAIGAERIVAGIDSRTARSPSKAGRRRSRSLPTSHPALEPYAGAFLYTHIDGEGLMQGFPIEIAARLRALTQRQLIVAGGIRARRKSTLSLRSGSTL
jgi:phosphoribosylformimino-5-aminoimidazole carboxamide ribotide isomerase